MVSPPNSCGEPVVNSSNHRTLALHANRHGTRNMITIDGSYGEGGGQIIRTALALSCVTGKAVRITNVRKNRSKPGLRPQHLTGVLACALISRAEVEGAALGSDSLVFSPHRISGGDYTFDVEQTAGKGSAGSVSLILQAILLPLSRADAPSRIVLHGGTHVPLSPSVQYLSEVYLPALREIGVRVEIDLVRWGFYPIGKGEVTGRVEPSPDLRGLTWDQPGRIARVSGASAVANLPSHIADRQRAAAAQTLAAAGIQTDIHLIEAPAVGRGTFCFLKADAHHCTGGFGSLGAIGKRAEAVGREAADECLAFVKSGAAVDRHLADQLLPYLALAHGPSTLTTEAVTSHLLTNQWVIRHFVDREITVEGEPGARGRIAVA
jgi:RNA 3'-terminal phosphate cyclase (ATP)